jgi:hypothetical protein
MGILRILPMRKLAEITAWKAVPLSVFSSLSAGVAEGYFAAGLRRSNTNFFPDD